MHVNVYCINYHLNRTTFIKNMYTIHQKYVHYSSKICTPFIKNMYTIHQKCEERIYLCYNSFIIDKFIIRKILHITFSSLRTFHLKYLLNLGRQRFTLKKSCKALIFSSNLKGVYNLFPHLFIFWIFFFLRSIIDKSFLFWAVFGWTWKVFRGVLPGFEQDIDGLMAACPPPFLPCPTKHDNWCFRCLLP